MHGLRRRLSRRDSLPKLCLSNNNCVKIDRAGAAAAFGGDLCGQSSLIDDIESPAKQRKMSVTPAEFRNPNHLVTSTPILGKDAFDHGLFNVARVRKFELSDLSPKVGFNGKSKRSNWKTF